MVKGLHDKDDDGAGGGVPQKASTGLGKTATFIKRGEDRRCLINVTQFINCLSQKSLGHSRESFRFCFIFEK